jgi:hypothetical protein
MMIKEGQIYEGAISISGSDDVPRKWIVVSPFGKLHIHSIDNPLELHCWPAPLIEEGLKNGQVYLIGDEPEHPMVKLQREKEALELHDTHLGLDNDSANRMLDLLQTATENGTETAPYIAGEILSSLERSNFSEEDRNEIEFLVNEQLNRLHSLQT